LHLFSSPLNGTIIAEF